MRHKWWLWLLLETAPVGILAAGDARAPWNQTVIANTDRGIIANSATSDLYVDRCDLAGEVWNPQIRNLSLAMGATLGGGGFVEPPGPLTKQMRGLGGCLLCQVVMDVSLLGGLTGHPPITGDMRAVGSS